MLPVLEEPAVRARMHPISVDTYHHLGEIGHLSERTELIRGAVLEQMPRTPLHSSIVRLLDCHLLAAIPDGFHPRSQEPLTFSDSEPEPDIAVVRGASDAYFQRHPNSAELVIEVCVSSESLDRIKLGVYAEAGVPECWLVLAEARTLERHTEPKDGRYQRVERAAYPAQLASTVFPGVNLPPPGLFPA